MRFRELNEGQWWQNSETIRLYHGTGSALLGHIREHGLRPPSEDLLEYALDVLADYIPREQWTAELIQTIEKTAARQQSGRGGDRGCVIYTFHRAQQVEGYARAYAQHGGEIAADVYRTACIFLMPENSTVLDLVNNPPLQPRFTDSRPVILGMDVPREWCIFHDDPEMIKSRIKQARRRGDNWASSKALPNVYRSVFDRQEIRIDRTVPYEMITFMRTLK